jgi:GNAT superfamily N-acetyltransferase
MLPRIDIAGAVTDADREVVYRWLRDYNRAENGDFVSALESGATKPLIVLARDERGEIAGGLFAEIQLKWLRVQIMAVSPARRRAGIGTLLLRQAEAEAVQRGCTHAYVDTMSFQSPEFYRRCGYVEVGRLPDWDSHGHDKYFLIKPLGGVA